MDTQKLTPTLNDQEIRENIDALKSGGLPDDQIQQYVDNYQKGSDGNYVLKGSVQTQPKKTFGEKVANTIESIFPGKVTGEALGAQSVKGDVLAGKTGAVPVDYSKLSPAALERLKEKGVPTNEADQRREVASKIESPNALQVAGDLGQAALSVAAPGVGEELGIGGRIAANAALGAGIGSTGAIAEGKSAGDVIKEGIVGGALGGGVSAAGEGLNKIAEHLPNWFVKKALPKLNPENAEFATQTLNAGSIKSNLEKSNLAVKSSGNAINSILNHPQYTEEVGNIESIIPEVSKHLPNAGLDDSAIIETIKSLAPKNATLVDRLAKGTLNISEQNTLRQELDKGIYPSIADKINPKLSFDKSIGKIIADGLRNNVQSTAKETIPLFEQYSKEINLNQALAVAKAKIAKGTPISLYDLTAGIGGGIPGIIVERVARTPAALVSAAKVIPKVVSTVSKTGKILKAPILKQVTK